MKSFSLVFGVALGLSAAVMPVAMRLSVRLGAMSEVGDATIALGSTNRGIG